jgi:hypothetical protein
VGLALAATRSEKAVGSGVVGPAGEEAVELVPRRWGEEEEEEEGIYTCVIDEHVDGFIFAESRADGFLEAARDVFGAEIDCSVRYMLPGDKCNG